jgi:hypothetical protein
VEEVQNLVVDGTEEEVAEIREEQIVDVVNMEAPGQERHNPEDRANDENQVDARAEQELRELARNLDNLGTVRLDAMGMSNFLIQTFTSETPSLTFAEWLVKFKDFKDQQNQHGNRTWKSQNLKCF